MYSEDKLCTVLRVYGYCVYCILSCSFEVMCSILNLKIADIFYKVCNFGMVEILECEKELKYLQKYTHLFEITW